MRYLVVGLVVYVAVSSLGAVINLPYTSLHYSVVSALLALIVWFIER